MQALSFIQSIFSFSFLLLSSLLFLLFSVLLCSVSPIFLLFSFLFFYLFFCFFFSFFLSFIFFLLYSSVLLSLFFSSLISYRLLFAFSLLLTFNRFWDEQCSMIRCYDYSLICLHFQLLDLIETYCVCTV